MIFLFSYLRKQYVNKDVQDEDDDVSDVDSVASDEFEEMLSKMSGGKNFMGEEDGDDNLDFMKDVGESLKKTGEGTNK